MKREADPHIGKRPQQVGDRGFAQRPGPPFANESTKHNQLFAPDGGHGSIEDELLPGKGPGRS